MKYDTHWLIKSLNDKGIKVTPLENYIDDKTPILFKCDLCGHEWRVDPSHLKGGRTCSECRKRNKLNTLKHDFIERSIKIHGNKYNYDKVVYVKQLQKVIITCPIHGDFEQSPNQHLRGQRCPLCAGNNFLRNTEYFVKLAKQVHGDLFNYDLVDYKTCKDSVIIKCNKCGHTFNQTPDKHLIGHGCPKCKLKAQTKLFEKLQFEFKNEEIEWEASPKWLLKQRFDIYFPKYNISVEYDGIQHFVPIKAFGGVSKLEYTKEQDKLKEEKCIKNGCKLFRLKYNYSEDDFTDLCDKIKTLIYK